MTSLKDLTGLFNKYSETVYLLPRHVEVLVNNSAILKDKVRFAATIVGVTAIITLLSVIAFNVSKSSPTFAEDEDFALSTDVTWQGFDTYMHRLDVIQRHLAIKSKAFQAITHGPHGFVQFSGYRLSARKFAAVGFGAHFLKDHLGETKCRWVGADDNSTIEGHVTVSYSGLNEDRDYDGIVLKCELNQATGSAGGDIFFTVAAEEFRVLTEANRDEVGIDVPRDENLPHYVTACVVRASKPPEPRPVYEWLSYHWHMGVTKFRLYDAGVVDQRLATVTSDFLTNGTLEVVPTRHLAVFRMAFDSHSLSVQDCLYSSYFTSRWLLVLSLDSYLYVSPPHNLFSYLAHHDDKPWLTFGSHEWSPTKCRVGLPLVKTDEWLGKRTSSPFTVEWLIFRKHEISCEGGDKQTCIGKSGQRSIFCNPRQAGLLGYHDVRDTQDSGHHAKYDDIHKHYFPSLYEAETYEKVCSEMVGDDEFSEGWTRDTTEAEYSKALRHSKAPVRDEPPELPEKKSEEKGK